MFIQWANPQFWLMTLYSLPAIMLALSVHEAAHAYAAYKCGDPTAKNLGRMTLDPTKHLDPIGTICLIFFRFGWAKPVPINPRNYNNPRRDNIIVSLAGIIANFLLSFIAAFILYITFYGIGIHNEIYVGIMQPIATINIGLGFFNLIPVPPLDGSHLLNDLLIRKAPKVYTFLNRYGYIILLILLVTGVIGTLLGFLIQGVYVGYMNLFSLLFPF